MQERLLMAIVVCDNHYYWFDKKYQSIFNEQFTGRVKGNKQYKSLMCMRSGVRGLTNKQTIH